MSRVALFGFEPARVDAGPSRLAASAIELARLVAVALLATCATPPVSPTPRATQGQRLGPQVVSQQPRKNDDVEPLATPSVAKLGACCSGPKKIDLQVPGFLPALLLVPAGEGTRPLVTAAHGAGGSPEWECDYWERLTSGRAFVLCLRGTPLNGQGGYYFQNHHALAAELSAAIAAAHGFSRRISSESGVYAGFSQGASMGSLMISKYAAQFPYVVLIEGFETWDVRLGRAFKAHGGEAVLFVCGTRQCATKAEHSTHALERAEVRARAEHAPGAGHTPTGPVMALVASDLRWLFGDDRAWSD